MSARYAAARCPLILAYELSEYAVALAVEDAHARHTHEYSVVDEVLHSV